MPPLKQEVAMTNKENTLNYMGNPLINDGFMGCMTNPKKPTYENINFVPDEKFEVKNADVVPLVTRYKRVSTRDDVESIQMAYRAMALNCLKTTYSSRVNVINTPHVTHDTVPVYKIQGIAVDPRFDAEGRLLRVWLMNPAVVDPNDPKNVIPVDTHLWLMMPRMTLDDLGGDAKISPTSGLGSDQLTVTLGDTVTIECTLKTYEALTGRGGRKRIGIEAWRPIDSKMIYCTRGDREQVVPRYLKGGLRLFSVDKYGILDSVNEWTWTRELDKALEGRPETAGVFYRVEEVVPRMKIQAAMHYFAEEAPWNQNETEDTFDNLNLPWIKTNGNSNH